MKGRGCTISRIQGTLKCSRYVETGDVVGNGILKQNTYERAHYRALMSSRAVRRRRLLHIKPSCARKLNASPVPFFF